jgi:hypothetical protein
MSGRAWRSAGVAAGALALLAGCTSGGRSAPAETTAGTPPPPVGSIAHPRPVQCLEGTTYTPPPSHRASPGSGTPSHPAPTEPPASKTDVAVGPLTLLSVGALAQGDQQGHSYHNGQGWHYRVDSEVRNAQLVTLTIGPEQRASTGLEYGLGYGMSPAPAVTFHGCPGAPTIFIGAFFVAGDGRACVPLDVRVGNGPPRRVVISFFHGHCPA